MMQNYQDHNQVVWFDDDLVTDPTLPIWDVSYWKGKNAIVGNAQGRGTTWFLDFGCFQAALRHYKRGGLFGKLIKDRYLFIGWGKTRCAEEFRLLLHLKSAGINVPRPIAARAVKSKLTYQADILSERIKNANDLISLLQITFIESNVYRLIGREIAKMHQAGVNHTDLNIHNILIDNNQNVWIIDFDKCTLCSHVKKNNKRDNLKRLLRSFNKEKKRKNIKWKESEFQALLKGYYEILPEQNFM